MRNPAAQGRPDKNHAEIKGFYEELFCTVLDLHSVGMGCPDFLVGVANNVDSLVEVKTEHGHLEPSQVRFARDWRGRKVTVVRNQSDVINHVQGIREELSRRKFL